jgi:peroxiredoxin
MMSGRAVLSVIVLAGASAAAGYVSYHWWPKQVATHARSAEGEIRPDFSLPDLDGKPRSATEWDGKVLIVNFWATWCDPCRREMPLLVQMQRTYGTKGLQVIGVAVDNLRDVKDYATKFAFNYPVLVGEEEAITLSQRLGNHMGVLPFTTVIDRQGRIAVTQTGELTRERAEQIILPLL